MHLKVQKTELSGRGVRNLNGSILIIWKLFQETDAQKCGNMQLKVNKKMITTK